LDLFQHERPQAGRQGARAKILSLRAGILPLVRPAFLGDIWALNRFLGEVKVGSVLIDQDFNDDGFLIGESLLARCWVGLIQP
jgi:hypothetical protein